jgi:hypothetical protein
MGDYIPTLPNSEERSDLEERKSVVIVMQLNPLSIDYDLTIAEANSVYGNEVTVIVSVRGADPKYFKESGGAVRLVGTWKCTTASTISHSGAGLFYFDGDGGAMLVGKPLTVTSGTDSQVQVEDVTYMSGIRSVFRFIVSDRGYGTQFAQPCQIGPCIHPGPIRWQCHSATKRYS